MVPVAIATLGAGLDRFTVVFVGWFGPRGLASVVFALIAYDSLSPGDGARVLSVVTVTVTLSVLLHGISASPLAARYATIDKDRTPGQPDRPTMDPLRVRSMGRRGANDERGPAST